MFRGNLPFPRAYPFMSTRLTFLRSLLPSPLTAFVSVSPAHCHASSPPPNPHKSIISSTTIFHRKSSTHNTTHQRIVARATSLSSPSTLSSSFVPNICRLMCRNPLTREALKRRCEAICGANGSCFSGGLILQRVHVS